MKNTFIIAEIGNNHFGSIHLAKELIQAAKESGADAVKGQVFFANKLTGSMGQDFYEQCATIFEHINDLIYYARSIDIDLFFSFFHGALEELESLMKYRKISASQFRDYALKNKKIKDWDLDRSDTFISIPSDVQLPILHNAIPMHVTDYLTDTPNLSRIDLMRDFYSGIRTEDVAIGYSDHTAGIENCFKAVKDHGASVIEKHFTLMHNLAWGGKVFRDTMHGADPGELKELVDRVRSL